WTGLGRGTRMGPAPAVEGEARIEGARGSFGRTGGNEEWYVNGPKGVEQGFTIASPPEGARDEALVIELAVEGDLAPARDEDGEGVTLRDARGATAARYTDLSAVGADGAPLRSWMEASGGAVRLHVDDAGARYPLRIDPVLWTQAAQFTYRDDGGNY